jgi:hypothetical protein
MQRNRQRILVDAPQFLEQQFGLAAGVDEEQRSAVRLDQFVDLDALRPTRFSRTQ